MREERLVEINGDLVVGPPSVSGRRERRRIRDAQSGVDPRNDEARRHDRAGQAAMPAGGTLRSESDVGIEVQTPVAAQTLTQTIEATEAVDVLLAADAAPHPDDRAVDLPAARQRQANVRLHSKLVVVLLPSFERTPLRRPGEEHARGDALLFLRRIHTLPAKAKVLTEVTAELHRAAQSGELRVVVGVK